MKIDGALPQALTGIRRGLDSARNHAGQIANNDNPAELVEPLVGLKRDELQVRASTEVLKAADRMIGSLFDEKA